MLLKHHNCQEKDSMQQNEIATLKFQGQTSVRYKSLLELSNISFKLLYFAMFRPFSDVVEQAKCCALLSSSLKFACRKDKTGWSCTTCKAAMLTPRRQHFQLVRNLTGLESQDIRQMLDVALKNNTQEKPKVSKERMERMAAAKEISLPVVIVEVLESEEMKKKKHNTMLLKRLACLL